MVKKRVLFVLAALLLAVFFTAFSASAEDYPILTGEKGLYNAGVYQVRLRGMGGFMTINVTFGPNAIEGMEVVDHTETPNIGTLAIERVIPAMMDAQSAEVDGVAGATITSDALKEALRQAIAQALSGEEAGAAKAIYAPGTYNIKLRGMGGFMTVAVTFSDDAIVDIQVPEHTETPNIGTLAIERVIPAMLEAQSAEVDGVAGATITSDALKEALRQAIAQALLPEEAAPAAGAYTPGTYNIKLRGMGGFMTVAVTFSETAIVDIQVPEHTETPNIGTLAIERVIPAMLEAQSAEVDGVTGATITSDALKDAVRQAISQAQGQ